MLTVYLGEYANIPFTRVGILNAFLVLILPLTVINFMDMLLKAGVKNQMCTGGSGARL